MANDNLCFHFGRDNNGNTLVSVSEDNQLVWPDLDKTGEWFGLVSECPFECPPKPERNFVF